MPALAYSFTSIKTHKTCLSDLQRQHDVGGGRYCLARAGQTHASIKWNTAFTRSSLWGGSRWKILLISPCRRRVIHEGSVVFCLRGLYLGKLPVAAKHRYASAG